jgi:nitrate/nitrite-specific signal transduction histidine kinase
MPTQQERLYEMLMERVRDDKYPSSQLLNRIEETMWTTDQLVQYIDLLLDKIDDAWYPSQQLLDRVQRLMALTVAASRVPA